MNTPALDFESLIGAIADVHRRLQHQATRAINTSLTLRNWLMGAYIHEFELRGKDRAEYGEPDCFEETLEKSQDGLRIRQALGRLPATHRRVLMDHFIQGRSVRHIAQREGIPVGTVLSRIFTAKRLLREAWEAAT